MSPVADGIPWARLLDAGLTHVEVLNTGILDTSEWIVTGPDARALVTIRLTWPGERWTVTTYTRAERHAGAPVTAREWVLEDSRTYLGDEVAVMLDDVAAIVG